MKFLRQWKSHVFIIYLQINLQIITIWMPWISSVCTCLLHLSKGVEGRSTAAVVLFPSSRWWNLHTTNTRIISWLTSLITGASGLGTSRPGPDCCGDLVGVTSLSIDSQTTKHSTKHPPLLLSFPWVFVSAYGTCFHQKTCMLFAKKVNSLHVHRSF